MRDLFNQGARWLTRQGDKVGRAYMAGADAQAAQVEAHKAALQKVPPGLALQTAPKQTPPMVLRGPVDPPAATQGRVTPDPYENARPADFAGNETWTFPGGAYTDWNRKRPGQGDGRFGTGFRVHKGGKPKPHHGVDIPMPVGAPVYADRDGQVFYAGGGKGYGWMIDAGPSPHDKSRYAHLDEILVKSGQRVKKGELIGRSGRTGNPNPSADLPELPALPRLTPPSSGGVGGVGPGVRRRLGAWP